MLFIESDQNEYDYICNVYFTDSWNGNEKYIVSIIDKSFVQGMLGGIGELSKLGLVITGDVLLHNLE